MRFTTEILARLKIVAERSGMNVSQLVRTATEQYLDEIERNGLISIDITAKSGNRLNEGRGGYGQKGRKPSKQSPEMKKLGELAGGDPLKNVKP